MTKPGCRREQFPKETTRVAKRASGPIGIFDSGVGGLTVLKEIRRVMPDESIIYFGDTARAPYGGKTTENLIAHGREIINFLLKFNAKMVVMACGTSSSVSYDTLRTEFPDLPIVDTIRPAAEETLRLARETPDFRPVFIATQATVNSGLFARLFAAESKTELHVRACPFFAPLVEGGFIGTHPLALFAAKNYLADLRGKINTLILGCTHYPLLKPALTRALGEIAYIDPAAATARAAAKNLPPPTGPPKIRYYTSGNTEKFSHLAKIILNENITPKKIASL